MAEDIYAPPKADLEVHDRDNPDYYVVSLQKFFLLTLLTNTIYLVYWFYRNWRNIKSRTGRKLMPPLRGFFFIFFTHSLFADVDQRLKARNSDFKWRPGILATWVVLVTIVSNVLDRLSASGLGSPISDLVSVLLIPVLAWLMLPAQRAVNTASGDPDGSGNETFTFANWFWMILGVLLWLLILFGLYSLFFAPELLVD